MKTESKIYLNSIKKVRNFVNQINQLDCDIDIRIGRYVIDAKSIMGIFSLDLSKVLTVEIHSNDKDEIIRFNQIIKPYEV